MLVRFDVRGQQGMDFINGGSIIVDYGFLVVMFLSAVWTSDLFTADDSFVQVL